MSEFKFKPAGFLPFKDSRECKRVRNIKKEEICCHPNKNFKIRTIEDQTVFGFAYILDIVAGYWATGCSAVLSQVLGVCDAGTGVSLFIMIRSGFRLSALPIIVH